MPRDAEQIDDELLVLRCQAGDERALEALVRRWSSPLLRHAWRHTGSREGAAEVAQEAWLSIVKGIRRLDDPSRFRAWAYRVVLNKSIDWVNARRREREDVRRLREQGDTSASTASLADARGVVDTVRAALGALPAERRSLLAMHYLDGLGVGEIADVLAIPTGTVKSRLHHARQELQRVIELTEQRELANPKETT